MSDDPYPTRSGPLNDLPAPIRADILECRLRLEAEDLLSVELGPSRGESPPEASQTVRGSMKLHPALRDEIESAADPVTGGSALFDALLPEGQPTLEAYREASRRARRERLRLCLSLTFDAELPPWIDDLPWERLYDPRWHLALGRTHSAALERRLDPPPDAPFAPLPPIEGELRLLMAVASPGDQRLHHFPELDRTWEEWTLGSALRRLEGLVDWHVLEGPASAERVRQELAERSYHALHLVVHGHRRPDQERARLLLEDAEGRGVWADHRQLAGILADDPALHLLTLVACHDGIETRSDPFRGLGPALVRRGVPAVVATRRALSITTARQLTGHLYRAFALEGRLDVALAETRAALARGADDPSGAWAPCLYSGRARGQSWKVEGEAWATLEQDTQAIELVRRRVERKKQEDREERARTGVFPEAPSEELRDGPGAELGDDDPQTAVRRLAVWWLAVASGAALLVAGVLTLVLDLDDHWPRGWLGPPEPTAAGGKRGQVPLDPEATRRALPRYERACIDGDARSCSRVAAIYEHGRAGRRDLPLAMDFYARACYGGQANACYYWGHLLEAGGDRGSGVVELYQRACEGGDARGCRRTTLLAAALEAAPGGSGRQPGAGAGIEQTGPSESELRETEPATGGAEGSDGPAGGGDAPGGSGGATSSVRGLVGDSTPSDSGPGGLVPDASVPDAAPGGVGEGSVGRALFAGSSGSDLAPAVVDGRNAVVGDFEASRLDPEAPSVTEEGLTVTEVGGTRFETRDSTSARGNVYGVAERVELFEVAVWLELEGARELTFSVLDSDRPDGRFLTLYSGAVTVEGRGADWYASELLELELEPDRFYLVAVAWEGEATYTYGLTPALTPAPSSDEASRVPPGQRTPFGWALHGHTDLAPLLPEVESEVLDLALYRQRLLTRQAEEEAP